MNFFKRKQKSEQEEVYDQKKIYNFDEQTIANILFIKIPKDLKITDIEKCIDSCSNEIFQYLRNFKNLKTNNKVENEKIRNYVKNYLSNLLTNKMDQDVGLLQLNLNDDSLLINKNDFEENNLEKENIGVNKIKTSKSQKMFQGGNQK